MSRAVATLFVLTLAAPAFATVRRVPLDHATIQAAIDASVSGDTVLIAPGTYTGTGNKNLDYGGRAITVAGETGNAADCVIDCEDSGRGFYFHTGEPAGAMLRALTIRNGLVGQGEMGGAMRITNAHPTLSSLVIESCEAPSSGGGSFEQSNSIVTACIFRQNHARFGAGGASITGGAPIVRDCTFAMNSAGPSQLPGAVGETGGGLATSVTGAVIERCRFLDNQVFLQTVLTDGGAGGAGITVFDTDTGAPTTIIRDCLVAGNSTAGRGGGILALAFARPLIETCTIYGNSAGQRGGGLAVIGMGICSQCPPPNLRNSIVVGNTAGEGGAQLEIGHWRFWQSSLVVEYCDVAGGAAAAFVDGQLTWGAGNIDADPLFANAVGGDFHLLTGSPCINAGDPAFAPATGELDIDHQRRVWAGRADMGADEFGSFPYGDLNCDGAANNFDIDAFVLALTNPAGYQATYPACDRLLGDVNFDGQLNNFDIDGFVAVLTG